MKIEESRSARKPKTAAKKSRKKHAKKSKSKSKSPEKKKQTGKRAKKKQKTRTQARAEVGDDENNRSSDEFKESNMDDVKPVIPTSTFDEIAAPIFAPHGFCLHTHAFIKKYYPKNS